MSVASLWVSVAFRWIHHEEAGHRFRASAWGHLMRGLDLISGTKRERPGGPISASSVRMTRPDQA